MRKLFLKEALGILAVNILHQSSHRILSPSKIIMLGSGEVASAKPPPQSGFENETQNVWKTRDDPKELLESQWGTAPFKV